MLVILCILYITILTQAQHHGEYFKQNPRCEKLFTSNIQSCMRHSTTLQSTLSNIHRCFITKFYLCHVTYSNGNDKIITYNGSLVPPTYQNQAALEDQSLPVQGYHLPICGLFGNFWQHLKPWKWDIKPLQYTFINMNILKFHLPASIPDCSLTGLRLSYENVSVHCGFLAPWMVIAETQLRVTFYKHPDLSTLGNQGFFAHYNFDDTKQLYKKVHTKGYCNKNKICYWHQKNIISYFPMDSTRTT